MSARMLCGFGETARKPSLIAAVSPKPRARAAVVAHATGLPGRGGAEVSG